ncbi:Protein of unknown function [Arachidicoccus rhizosphaerae]|jgi:hypothetical protein|uniref:YhcG N-terminal domain-containing protein n=1 Tax=Arachidicoccus rhizosphaerae TaxID=551991 RepID=A0A1H4BL92_9BACT|nr:DUF1016 N-terminal domain-containing protein [Arachidicoccus rhizosphaerae]SEA48955.1 Protein of unknown function [Arachidicoccus rhizosphaerae]
MDNRFTEIIDLIQQARIKAVRSVNAELINLYWNVGEYIFNKVENKEWGVSVVSDLAQYIQRNEPGIKGFTDKNLWRMKQFYESYKDVPKLSTVLRQISCSHNLAILLDMVDKLEPDSNIVADSYNKDNFYEDQKEKYGF